jgi:hypothetical protein
MSKKLKTSHEPLHGQGSYAKVYKHHDPSLLIKRMTKSKNQFNSKTTIQKKQANINSIDSQRKYLGSPIIHFN